MDFGDIDDDALNELCDDIESTIKSEEIKTEATSDISKPENVLPRAEINENPTSTHLEMLSQYFGHKSFRPLQWEIISAIINDKRDVCAIMSTGYGKSLCFQYPSVFLSGITLVISPLIALMEDQVLSLEVANIPACLLGTAQKQQKQVIEDIFKKKYLIVYLTPEFCTGDYGSDLLHRMNSELNVVLIAIDEAHCISSWGHDFRHQYRNLIVLRNIFTNVPIIAVTATATSKVQNDIIKNLNLTNPLVVCSGFDRPNLYFQVSSKGPGVYEDLKKFMVYDENQWRFSGSTIIYCITRKETEDVAGLLTDSGIKCLAYHAGLRMEARKAAHELFVKDKVNVIVATIAFGMGIDKPDIRNVIHYGTSKTIESYYQEVGRAGRDGLAANCATFFANGDFARLRYICGAKQQHEGLKQMENYLTTTKCRRRFILEHFGDNLGHLENPKHSCCDNCTRKLCDGRADHEKYEGVDENGCFDFSESARKFLGAVQAFGGKFGLSTYILFIRGSTSSKIPDQKKRMASYGAGKDKSDVWWQAVARLLIQQQFLCETSERTKQGYQYTSIKITEKGCCFIYSNGKLLLQPPTTILKLLKQKPAACSTWISTKSEPSTSKPIVEQTETQQEIDARMHLYQQLLNKRSEIALQLDCMPYMVASNAALMEMSKVKPRTMTELQNLNLNGFAEAKRNKFGQKFLDIIALNSNSVRSKTICKILEDNPLPDVTKLNGTSQVSWSLFKSGLSPAQIAEKRSLSLSTVNSHLLNALKLGYPVKLSQLGISEEIRDLIMKMYRKIHPTGFTPVMLHTIKEMCPSEVTFNEIKTVLGYLQVRCHLETLKAPYEEFEDFEYGDVNIEKKDVSFEAPAAKKAKIKEEDEFDFNSVLDSPPRETKENRVVKEEIVEVRTEVSAPINTQKSKKKALPPWLQVKKIS